MKRQTSVYILALAALASTALALDLTTPAKPVSGTMPTSTAPGDKTALDAATGVSPTTPDQSLIPLMVKERPDQTTITAKVTNLQTKGESIGIDQMNIEGSNSSKPTEAGTKQVNIMWGVASMNDKEGTKYTTPITKPLTSEIETQAETDVQTGATFTAKGDPKELLDAYARLQEMMNKKQQEQKTADNKEETKASKDSGAQNTDDTKDEAIATPQTAVKTDPVITTTTDGCNINVDQDQMVAIVQEKTLEDGKEVAACQDTLTRYPLEKTYNTCPVSIGDSAVYQQFTLRYKDPASGGYIQVADCTPDHDKAIPVTVDTASCSIRHDTTAGISYQQGKKTYVDSNGATQTLQSCQDTGVTYTQVTTRDTCTPVVDSVGKTVTFQSRRKITVDGTEQYISECLPETTSQAISEEVCTSPRYTNDFNTHTSYLNKTYYYTDDKGKRVDIAVCQPSTTSFAHEVDETSCTATNDDTQRITIMYGKTYIEETSGTKVFLSNCQSISPTIPYAKLGEVWQATASAAKNFSLNADENKDITQVSDIYTSCYSPYVDNYNSYSWCDVSSTTVGYNGQKFRVNTYNENRRTNYYTDDGQTTYFRRAGSANGSVSCLKAKTLPWTTTDGLTVDTANSTVKPKTTASYSLNGYSTQTNGAFLEFVLSGSYGAPNAAAPTYNVAFMCGAPSCNMVTLNGRNKYTRGDGTIFTDTSVSTGIKYICGDGSNLDGKTK